MPNEEFSDVSEEEYKEATDRLLRQEQERHSNRLDYSIYTDDAPSVSARRSLERALRAHGHFYL
jgi:hypothetical protein